MSLLQGIFHNYLAQAAFFSWFIAQVIKFIIVMIKEQTLRWERLVGSGGFPSSHTSFVVGTTMALLLKYGPDSDLFVLALVLSCVVMYDASHVRLEAGKQAAVLNDIIDFIKAHKLPVPLENKAALKELLGHTPIEVWGGFILGIIVACVQYYYVYQGAV